MGFAGGFLLGGDLLSSVNCLLGLVLLIEIEEIGRY